MSNPAESGPPPVESPPPTQKKCVVCGTLIDVDAKKCKECKMYQRLRTCSVCGSLMPEKGRRCNDCGSFQGWRRIIPQNAVVLALIVSLVSLLSTLIPVLINLAGRGSQTSATFLGMRRLKDATNSEKLVIAVLASNSGGTMSRVEGAQLNLTSLGVGLGFVPLSVVNPIQQDVPANGRSEIELYAGSIDAHTENLTSDEGATLKAKIITDLCHEAVVISLSVRETGMRGRLKEKPSVRTAPIEGRYLRPWLWERIHGVHPKQTCP
jgi:predicted nucleic acid-binding Zn ribbon protein